jgi:predicted RNase H-like nuclease
VFVLDVDVRLDVHARLGDVHARANDPSDPMSALLVGFDSAWTRKKAGAVAGALLDDAGAVRELGAPRLVRFEEATSVIAGWQTEHRPSSTLVLIDQPTIVENQTGQRQVERIVCSVVSRRRGGMQPAYKAASTCSVPTPPSGRSLLRSVEE